MSDNDRIVKVSKGTEAALVATAAELGLTEEETLQLAVDVFEQVARTPLSPFTSLKMTYESLPFALEVSKKAKGRL